MVYGSFNGMASRKSAAFGEGSVAWRASCSKLLGLNCRAQSVRLWGCRVCTNISEWSAKGRMIAMGADARVAELNLELPPAPKPVATYLTAVRHGDLLYVSGHGPYRSDGTLITGRLGAGMSVQEGQMAARQTGLAILATLMVHLGSLDKVVRLIKTLGMVNSTPDFGEQPKVINGYSDLMKEVFGEAGVGARSAVGMGALPGGIAVEIEAIFQVKD